MTYDQILILRRDFTLASKRWAWLAANLGRGQRLDPISRKEMGSLIESLCICSMKNTSIIRH